MLRVGLIGCGKMGVQHLRAIAAIPGAQVVGVADPQADRELIASLLPPNARIVATAAELLALKPDVVHVVTPPATHTSLALQAIEAGVHVYIEKPFTPTRAAAREILERAANRGVKVCAGHQCLFEAPAVKAAALLPAIGRLVHVESYFSFRTARRTITPVDQAKDILPHAVYPLVEQLRIGSGVSDMPIQIVGLTARASGDIYALVRLGECTGVLVVTLSGRPIEQYQHLVGTNGWIRVDYITGSVTYLSGPGTGPGALLTPYRRASQTVIGATKGFARLLFRHGSSYAGLQPLIEQFYASISSGRPAPLSPESIVDTVTLCEHIGEALDQAAGQDDRAAQTRLADREAALPPVDPMRGVVLVTGGTGLLGRRVAQELRAAGLSVRALARRIPRPAVRVAGIEYVTGDLASGLQPGLLRGVHTVVHCAAETAGRKEDHERNSIGATRHVIEAAAAAGVSAVIHVSSVAVLKPSHEVGGAVDEHTPIDAGNLKRGPYTWGKAESELLAVRLGRELNVPVKVIRPGPLVDYNEFTPPGRLGRELGPWFVAIGGKTTPLSVCDVSTAARVIRSYVQDFDGAPPVLNLIEAPPPTRRELAERLRAARPDLRFIWVPTMVLRLISGPAKLAQRILLRAEKPLDLYAAFSSERYRADLAADVIRKAGPTPRIRSGERDPAAC